MQLDDYLKEHEPETTDEQFGDRIGRSRTQVFKYRHRLAIPRHADGTMDAIKRETRGLVTEVDFYSKKPSAEVGSKLAITT